MKAWILAAMTVCTAGSVYADAVDDMCLESKQTGDLCSCASARLKSDVGDADYALYEATGKAYSAKKAAGMGMGDAWDAAVKAQATQRGEGFVETLNRTNSIGKAHRRAMKDCAG